MWTVFSILGIAVKEELALTDTQLGLLMATQFLPAPLVRFFLGVLTDSFGGRWVFGLLMLTSAGCVFLLGAQQLHHALVGALGVGLAGGSFIVGVAFSAAWYERGKRAPHWAFLVLVMWVRRSTILCAISAC